MIAMVNMPFASLMVPPLPVGLLKARLNRAGLLCTAFNFNFLFARFIGIGAYQSIIGSQSTGLLGEWLFAPAAWQEKLPEIPPDFFLEFSGLPAGMNRDRVLDIRTRVIPEFIDAAAARILDTAHIRFAGFSCSFFQTIPSLALIRRLKELRPEIKVVCGGAGFHGAAGWEFMDKIECIDVVSLGEADDVIVPLFRALTQEKDPEKLQGIVYRDKQGRVRQGAAYRPVSMETLEGNPPPDYDEYFHDLAGCGLLQDEVIRGKLFNVIETSRGCWKGEKQHCTFCGLSSEDIHFRQISTGRVLETLDNLMQRYPLRQFMLADNILPKTFFSELLPRLRDRPAAERIKLLTECRTTLNRRDVELMAAAGLVWVVAGIESLSSHILECMQKGVTMLRNIYYLKMCRTYGVYPMWKLLLRVPGERVDDYSRMAALIPKIIHFTPPSWPDRKIELQRFSPYFDHPGRWVAHIRPRRFYRSMYPDDLLDIRNVAYYFEADWKDVLDGDDPYREVLEQVRIWRQVWRYSPLRCGLVHESLPGGRIRLIDTRGSVQPVMLELDVVESTVFKAIDDPVAARKLESGPWPEAGIEARVKPILEDFVRQGIAVEENGRYLGLAIPANAAVPNLPF